MRHIRLRTLLLEKLSVSDAEKIFADYGVPHATRIDKDKLTKLYKLLVTKHHPDRGGNTKDMQYINAAWDVLKRLSPSRPIDPTTNRSKDIEPWAWAGYSGGIPPRDDVGGPGDLNYYKKKAWEISGKPEPRKENEYTFWGWDGNYFRGVFSVFAVPKTLFEVSEMMVEWQGFFHITAVFYSQRDNPHSIFLINLNGKEIDPPREFEHESFNSNPGNDRSFVYYLRSHLNTDINEDQSEKEDYGYFLRFGRIPPIGRSRNVLSGGLERGASAYPAFWNDDHDIWELDTSQLTDVGLGTLDSFIDDYRIGKGKKIYLLYAQIPQDAGIHDNEPLLNAKTVKVIKELKPEEVWIDEYDGNQWAYGGADYSQYMRKD